MRINLCSFNFNGYGTLQALYIADSHPGGGCRESNGSEASEDIRMTVHGAGANDSAYLIGTSALGSSARGVAAGHADRLISGDRAADHTKNCPVVGFSIGPKVRFTLSKHLSVAAGEVIFLVLAGFRGHSNGTYSVLVESVTITLSAWGRCLDRYSVRVRVLGLISLRGSASQQVR